MKETRNPTPSTNNANDAATTKDTQSKADATSSETLSDIEKSALVSDEQSSSDAQDQGERPTNAPPDGDFDADNADGGRGRNDKGLM